MGDDWIVDGALDVTAPDGLGAGVVGCGSAYNANTAGRFATSLSVVAVPAKSSRSGGKVGLADGATVAPGDAPGAPGGL